MGGGVRREGGACGDVIKTLKRTWCFSPVFSSRSAFSSCVFLTFFFFSTASISPRSSFFFPLFPSTSKKMAAPGGGAPFDFSALSSVLNDPSIREMAESIANNPAFASMTQSLQASLLGGAAAGGEGASNADAADAAAAPDAGAAGAPGMPPIDPSKYAEVMSSVMGNPDFLTMAEKLGKQIMAVSFFFFVPRVGDGDVPPLKKKERQQ